MSQPAAKKTARRTGKKTGARTRPANAKRLTKSAVSAGKRRRAS